MSDSGNNGFGGCGLVGFIVAGLLSWFKWGKIGWALLAALFNWFYVIYYVIRYGFEGFANWF